MPGKSALVVDDDDSIRKVIEVVLRGIGYTSVVLAEDGVVGLQEVEKFGKNFDLVICDWMMPNLDGLGFLEKFRVLQPDTPFVMLTAKSGTSDFNEAKRKGANYFFMKPFEPADLKVRIQAMIG